MMESNSSFDGDLTETDVNYVTYDLTQLPKWARHLQLAYLVFIMVCGATGNSLLLVVEQRKNNKSSTDYFILTMAVMELFCSLTTTTLNMLRSDIYTMSSALCKVLVFVSYQMNFSEVLLLASIAVDRYIKTCKPLIMSFTVRKAKVICALITFSSLLVSTPSLVTYNLDINFDCGHRHPLMRLFQRILIAVFTVILGLVLIAYIKVALAIRRRHNQYVDRHLHGINVLKGTPSRMNTLQSWKLFKKQTWRRKTAPAENHTQTMIPTKSTNSQPTSVSFSNNHHRVHDLNPERSKSPELNLKLDTYMTSGQSKLNSQDNSGNSVRALGLQVENNQVLNNLRQEEQRVNRITRTLFLITFIYIMTLFLQTMLVVPSETVLGVVIKYFSQTINLTNCCINPLLIFGMHSRYRDEVKKLLICRAQ